MILIFEVWITKMQNISLLVDLTLIYVRLPVPHLLSFITAIAQKSINKTCTLHVLSEKNDKNNPFSMWCSAIKMHAISVHTHMLGLISSWLSLFISNHLFPTWLQLRFYATRPKTPFWNASWLCLHCNLCGWVLQDRVALKFNGFKGHFILATHRPATNCPGDMNTY